MNFPSLPPNARSQRSDGAEARERLVLAALRLFAEKGYSATSTREIAQAAGANIAAISYYFGDKAGLYREVYTRPAGMPGVQAAQYDQQGMSLRQSLEAFITSFIEPLKQGALMQQCMRLHFREMLEPTGLWAEELEQTIKPAHAGLTAVLCRHLGLAEADDGIHRLAFAVTGLPIHLFVCSDVIAAIRPTLTATSSAIDEEVQVLVGYAEAMVNSESARRAIQGATSPTRAATPTKGKKQ